MIVTVRRGTSVLFRGDRFDFSAWLRPAGLSFLSVCSGIEAASVAWSSLGWHALGFAEIEKFPSAVLAHHYPNVPNHGDFTKIDPAPLRGCVDILCGGTPCQAFSVAGMRGSLDDARGNLTLAFVDLAHAIAPRNVVWENVPGVLSTKDNAFGCFLAGLVGADGPFLPTEPQPATGKSSRFWRWNGKEKRHYVAWPLAGLVHGPKGRAAWRVLDAQYFGLAQRRKRVIVVADFGNGADPAAVLFEPEGVRRDSPPRRETGQGFTAAVAPSLVASGRGVERTGDNGVLTAGVACYAPEIARCIATREGQSQDFESTTMVACLTGEITHALKAEGADASEDGTGRGTPIVVQSVALRGREGGATAELGDDLAHALRASGGGGGDKPHVLTHAIQAGALRENPLSGPDGVGVQADIAYTLEARAEVQAVQMVSAVRRLTPRECERLQGFQWQCSLDYPGAWQDHSGRWWSPDYTAIKYGNISKAKLDADFVKYMARGNPKRLTREDVAALASDGPRYKALGNSWAVPKFTWLGERIQRFMP